MIDIKSLTLPELQEEMEKIGEKKFRAGQIYEWMHVKLVDSFDEMTNLSKGLREKLKEQYELISLELVEVQTSKIDETSKFLFRLSDGNVIESVLNPAPVRTAYNMTVPALAIPGAPIEEAIARSIIVK